MFIWFVTASMLDRRWYRPAMPRSSILPLAAAVAAVALGASPALAAPLPRERDGAKIVAFPLLAVQGKAPASVGSHVSHSSHVSGSGGGHVSHASHVSSIPAPPPITVAPPPAPVASATTSPTPSSSPAQTASASASADGSPRVAPSHGSGTTSAAAVGSSSPATGQGGGCAFLIVAPFGALAGRIRHLARRRRTE
jgi:hypothetical protein